MKPRLIVIYLSVVLFVFIGLQVGIAAACCNDCNHRTPGYWKNHPEEWIGVEYMDLDQEKLLVWLNSPVAGDKRVTMFKALIAAYLNKTLLGCSPCGWF